MAESVPYVHAVVPAGYAHALAMKSDIGTVTDERYVVKTALNETFGPEAVRPWRLLRRSAQGYEVLGHWNGGGSGPEHSEAMMKAGLVHRPLSFGLPAAGETVELEFELAAVKKVTRRDPVTRKVLARNFLDVSVSRQEGPDGRYVYVEASGPERNEAYMAWLFNLVLEGDYGCSPRGLPRVISADSVRHLRKLGPDRRVRSMATPRLLASMPVTVTDAARFSGMLASGVKKLKDIGLGSVLPVQVLQEAGA